MNAVEAKDYLDGEFGKKLGIEGPLKRRSHTRIYLAKNGVSFAVIIGTSKFPTKRTRLILTKLPSEPHKDVEELPEDFRWNGNTLKGTNLEHSQRSILVHSLEALQWVIRDLSADAIQTSRLPSNLHDARASGSEHLLQAIALAASIIKGTVSLAEAVRSLVREYDLAQSSARDTLYILRKMHSGEVFKRALNHAHLDFVLSSFDLETFISLRSAIFATEQHVKYRESRGLNQTAVKAILSTHINRLMLLPIASAPIVLEKISQDFAAAVLEAQRGNRLERLRRLKDAPSRPEIIMRTVCLFVRNPDVVAEALFRANGNCEICHAPAPFRRTSNGSPFLEVHHRVRLADGGMDIVENAVAVCPNCHRKQHYGI